MGVSSGCGYKEVYSYIDFLKISYPYSSCICSFLQQHSYSLFIKKNVFRSCFITSWSFFYLIFFTHSIRATMGVPRKPYEGLHIMFYRRRSTHKRKLRILRWTSAVKKNDFKERGVDLEVEGLRYIQMHRGPHTYWAPGASFKGRRSRTRGRSQCVFVKIWRSILTCSGV